MRRWLILVPLLLLLVYLATGIFQVQGREEAVVVRFGRPLPETRGPGLHFGLPWGMDRVVRVAVGERRRLVVGYVPVDAPQQERLPEGQVLTGDNHLINVRVIVEYIVHPQQVTDYVLHLDRLESVLAKLTEETMVLVLANEKAETVLLARSALLEKRLRETLEKRLRDYSLGIQIADVTLPKAEAPEELKEVYLELNRAHAQKDILKRDAAAQRDSAVSQAQQQKLRTVTEARSKTEQKVLLARTEAKSFSKLMNSLPACGPARANALLNLYLNEMQAVFARLKVRTVSDPRGKENLLVPFPP